MVASPCAPKNSNDSHGLPVDFPFKPPKERGYPQTQTNPNVPCLAEFRSEPLLAWLALQAEEHKNPKRCAIHDIFLRVPSLVPLEGTKGRGGSHRKRRAHTSDSQVGLQFGLGESGSSTCMYPSPSDPNLVWKGDLKEEVSLGLPPYGMWSCVPPT